MIQHLNYEFFSFDDCKRLNVLYMKEKSFTLGRVWAHQGPHKL